VNGGHWGSKAIVAQGAMAMLHVDVDKQTQNPICS